MHVSGDRVLYPAALYANGWMEGPFRLRKGALAGLMSTTAKFSTELFTE